MKDSTRTALAMILMIVILLISQKLIWDKNKKISPINDISQTEEKNESTEKSNPEMTEKTAEIKLDSLNLKNDSVLDQNSEITEAENVKITTDKYELNINPFNLIFEDLVLRKFKSNTEDDKESQLNLIRNKKGFNLQIFKDNENKTIYFEPDKTELLLSGNQKDSINFVLSSEGVTLINVKMVFYGDSYIIRNSMIVNESFKKEVDRIALDWYNGVANSEIKKYEERFHEAIIKIGDDLDEISQNKFEDIYEDEKERITKNGTIYWIGVRKKYFGAFLIPHEPVETAEFLSLREGNRIGLNIPLPRYYESFSFDIYAGPLDAKEMAKSKWQLENGSESGWGILRPISRIILWFLELFYKFIPNYGIAIMLLAVLLKIVTTPLNHKTMVSAEMMKRLQPEMAKIKEKYHNDPKKQQMELMALYQKYGVNPLGGCLPILIQMPIFFAFYPVLNRFIELRGAAFMLWLTDLSVPDPYYILPLLMGAAVFVQQKMTITDPKQKMMIYFMPILLVVIFKGLPAGLVLYWFTFNVLSIIHQYIFHNTFKPNQINQKG